MDGEKVFELARKCPDLDKCGMKICSNAISRIVEESQREIDAAFDEAAKAIRNYPRLTDGIIGPEINRALDSIEDAIHKLKSNKGGR